MIAAPAAAAGDRFSSGGIVSCATIAAAGVPAPRRMRDATPPDRAHEPGPPRGAIPARAGVGFKSRHADEVLHAAHGVDWFEVHAENYMVRGGPRLRELELLRARFPLSLHGVGLSLGGAQAPDRAHLAALRALVDRFEPGLVSEHIAWSGHTGRYLADLLPVPLTGGALARLVEAIVQTQDALRRRILIENPATYFALPQSEIPEPQFLTAAARASGCALLVDVNNVFVSAHNLGFDAAGYVDALPAELIEEIHVAGHEHERRDGDSILIDTHGAPVAGEVWDLYARLIARIGPRPTLLERDNDVPPWCELEAEARTAQRIAAAACRHAGSAA
jgi:hypothetical protein